MRSCARLRGRCSEVSAYINAHAEEVDENGHRLAVRNGPQHEREVITAAGPVPVLAPQVDDKTRPIPPVPPA